MEAVVRRQLCQRRVSELLEDVDEWGPPTKRLREGAVFVGDVDSSLGPAAPVFVLQVDRDAKSLGHDLPTQSAASTSGQRAPTQLSTRARARATAICSASGRATVSDARALLTREIQKIQKIRQGPCDAVVDTSVDEDGLYECSIARMSISRFWSVVPSDYDRFASLLRSAWYYLHTLT